MTSFKYGTHYYGPATIVVTNWDFVEPPLPKLHFHAQLHDRVMLSKSMSLLDVLRIVHDRQLTMRSNSDFPHLTLAGVSIEADSYGPKVLCRSEEQWQAALASIPMIRGEPAYRIHLVVYMVPVQQVSPFVAHWENNSDAIVGKLNLYPSYGCTPREPNNVYHHYYHHNDHDGYRRHHGHHHHHGHRYHHGYPHEHHHEWSTSPHRKHHDSQHLHEVVEEKEWRVITTHNDDHKRSRGYDTLINEGGPNMHLNKRTGVSKIYDHGHGLIGPLTHPRASYRVGLEKNRHEHGDTGIDVAVTGSRHGRRSPHWDDYDHDDHAFYVVPALKRRSKL